MAATPLLAASAPVVRGDLQEHFSERVKASTAAAIVGLGVGATDGPADITRVRLDVPNFPTDRRICVNATTRDGVYVAYGLFTAVARLGGEAPISQTSRYGSALRRYGARDLAVRARVGADCDINPKAPFLATRLGPDNGKLTLMVQARRMRHVEVRLIDRAGGRAAAACATDPNKSGAAFAWICVVNLAGLRRDGTASLEIISRDSIDEETSEKASLLWR